jgi:glycosyltransferase involved in cell wall biosynthesis
VIRVLHLSTSDSGGGAARAAYRLHTGLRRAGVESSMLVWEKKTDDPHVRRLKRPAGVLARMKHRLRAGAIARDAARYPNRPPSLDLFSDDRAPDGDRLLAHLPPCDVINLHWVAGFVDYGGFFPAAARLGTPLVWRLADMNAFTGGCHYDDGSGKFTAQCGACHQLGSSDENDLSRQVWLRKKAALSQVPKGGLHLVATSRWIEGEAKRSSLLGDRDVTVIPNGLDVSDFAPRDRKFSRDFFDLPPDAKIVLFAADSAANVRKGFAYLAEALAGMRDVDNLLLVSVGGGEPKVEGVPHRHLGRINDDRVLSLAYSAADVYAIASLQESFGQTVSESLACGTPVAAFATGGIVDMVRPGVTGELAPTRDVAALRAAVKRLLLSDPDNRSRMADNCRRIAVAEYSLEVQAKQYEALYHSLIEARRANSSRARTSPDDRV